MADKVALVRLRAKIDEYEAAMGRARKVTSEFADSAKGLTSRINFAQVGQTLTRNVTLPLVAAGGAAVAMATKFDDTFRQMQALAGVTADEVAGLRQAVLDLAGETAQSPQELAEAFYFIRSAGIEGATALDILEMSAKGATAGLGDAAVVADALTSVIGAYGEANISAAEAADVLVFAAREGKAEAAELAPQFGRLLPIAAQLGVQFWELGAGLAFLSRSGGGAELAATNMLNVLSKLLNPSEEGVRALQQMGMSVDDLRASIRERGLLDTLVWLRESLEANGMELGDFSRDMQFTVGALALTAEGGDRAREVFDEWTNSVGALNDAFELAAQGPGFQFRQAMSEMHGTMIQIGDTIAPLAARVLGFVADIAQAFGSLPGVAQTGVLALLGIAAAVGPVMQAIARFRQAQQWIAALGPAGERAAAGLGKVGAAFGRVMSGAAAARVASGLLESVFGVEAQEDLSNYRAQLELLGRTGQTTSLDIQGIVDAFNVVGDPSLWDNTTAAISRGIGGISSLASTFTLGVFPDWDSTTERFDKRIKEFDRTLAELVTSGNAEAAAAALSAVMTAAAEQGVDVDRVRGMLELYDEALALAAAQASDTAGDLDVLTDGAREQQQAWEDVERSLSDYLDSLRAAVDPFFAVIHATAANQEAQERLNEVLASSEASQRDVEAAHLAVAESAAELEAAMIDLAARMEFQGLTAEQARASLDRWVQQGTITRGTADALAEAIARPTQQLDRFAGDWLATIRVNDRATPVINHIMGAVRAVLSMVSRTLFIRAATGGQTGGWAGMQPPGPQDTIPALLAPGEFIIRREAAEALGPATLAALNSYRGGPVPVPVSWQGASPSPSAPSGPTQITLRFEGGDTSLLTWLRRTVRVEGGGDVQVALGGAR